MKPYYYADFETQARIIRTRFERRLQAQTAGMFSPELIRLTTMKTNADINAAMQRLFKRITKFLGHDNKYDGKGNLR